MEVVYIGSIVCALITAFVLLRTQTTYQAFSDRLLAAFLLSASFCALLYLLIISGTILSVPHLFKTAAPVNFLIPPLAYLYVRSVLNNETSFRKRDLFHWIPFVIILSNYLPFYLTSAESKIIILQEIGAEKWKGTGFINEALQFILREIQAVVYLIFQWKLIIDFKKSGDYGMGAHTRQVLAWLRAFSSIIFINFVSIVFSVVVANSDLFTSWKMELLEAADIVFGVGFFILCSYLLVNPSVLYGLPFLEGTTLLPGKIKPKVSEPLENDSKYETQLSQLVEYFEKEKPYLIKGLTISEISVELDISPRNISFILNNHMGVGFNDFVNKYRVNAFIEKLNEGYLKSFTLESLAKEVGFSSGRTLHRAFIKSYGISPSDYINRMVNK
jgi:AraC-like DNA-binding protein